MMAMPAELSLFLVVSGRLSLSWMFFVAVFAAVRETERLEPGHQKRPTVVKCTTIFSVPVGCKNVRRSAAKPVGGCRRSRALG
jgi:hypothetical protein